MGLTKPKYNNLDTSKFEIGDPITEINVNVDPANPNNSDVGFIFNRGTTGDNVGLLWDKSAQEFVLVLTSATGSDVGDLPITSYQNFQCNDINANLVTSSATSPTAVDHLTRKDYVDAGDVYNNVTILNSTNDLDLIVTNGHYTWSSSIPSNTPISNADYKHMIVEFDGDQYSQFVWGGTDGSSIIATRRKDSGVWKAWEIFAKESTASGSFTTVDSKTVTVVNGIITSIV